ncbi:MAG: hypothetical protein GY870_17975 [archaeon]|nr:hypothetical protein [archaeon]
MDEISEKKIKNKKEMEKRLQKLIKKDLKSVSVNVDFMSEVMLNRFDFDCEKIFMKLEEKLDRLKSLF